MILTGLTWSACAGASRETATSAASTSSAQASSGVAPGASVPSSDLDLSITYNPGYTAHLGWVRLKEPIGLQYLGNPGATVADFDEDWSRTKSDPLLLKLFALQVAKLDWSTTSVLLDEGHLCSPQLQEAVDRASPSRLLLRIERGLTDVGVSCLQRLSAPRLYLAGCLYRGHRADERCDGDAELSLLASDEGVRKRVFGLAVSLSEQASLERLRQFPELEYLAIAPGRAPEPHADFATLPFDGLPKLRYLDVTSWEREQRIFGFPAELRFLGHLHTLRWQGQLLAPLRSCELQRFSSARVSDADLRALSTCNKLVELSTDDAEIKSAAALAAFPRLTRLHLRHLPAEDLSPLGGLTALRELSLPASKASDVRFIARLPELRNVTLSQTPLTDLTVFAGLQHLATLDVGFTKVADLAPLRGLHTLTDLDLHETAVVDVAPLAGLRLLTELNLSATPVTDLSPLRQHPALEWVVLYESKLRDVGALLTMPRLKRAHIGGLSLPPEQLAALKQRLRYQLDGAP